MTEEEMALLRELEAMARRRREIRARLDEIEAERAASEGAPRRVALSK